MFLKRLYSEPPGLFRSGKSEHPFTIVFKEGINFIFGKKDNVSDSKDSLNGLGKSTLADLIDFCLLADFKKNSRLYKEKARLEGHTIVLEFEANGIQYILKRNSKNARKVVFGKLDEESEMDLKDAKIKLFHLFFHNPEYEGVLDDKWYRSLMSFFLKIHKKNKKGDFSDPINFLTANNRPSELNQYHFFLMGIDNKLLCKNFELQKDVKERNTAIKQVKRLVEKNYNLSINQVDTQLSKLKNEVKKIKIAIEAFKLAEQYKDIEDKLNEFTGEIKRLSEQNFWMNKKIHSYRESYQLNDTLSNYRIKNIEKLYGEINSHLKGVVSKSLKDAVSFRKRLAQSREEFLKEEMQELESYIRNNEGKIQDLDTQRQKLFSFLQSKEAFSDLTEAFYYLGEREKELSDLEGKIKTFRDLQAEKVDYDAKDAHLKQDVITFLDEIKDEIDAFEKLFSEVYNYIYPENQSSGFSITPNYGVNKVDINISFDKDESKGWNKGRTLVYDIAIMLNAIREGIQMPRFLLHDGIFDGMDKAQFVALYHFIQNNNQLGYKLQYIVTMIEEGELKSNFGETDELTVDKITETAIAILTPSQPFWNSA